MPSTYRHGKAVKVKKKNAYKYISIYIADLKFCNSVQYRRVNNYFMLKISQKINDIYCKNLVIGSKHFKINMKVFICSLQVPQ